MLPVNATNVVQQRQGLFKLVTPQTVKVLTGLNANIQEDTLEIPIQTAQAFRIGGTLGKTLYDKLCAQWVTAAYDRNNLPTAAPDGVNYQELYDQVVLPLCWWAYVESLVVLAVSIDNKGVMLNTSEYQENAGKDGYYLLINRQQKTAEAYIDRLAEYVCKTFKNDNDVSQEASKNGGTRFTFGFQSGDSCNC